ncbi:hypothetical protein [Pseudoxanthomonas daejeonensis]|uniref:hypothetical protein n=1 Tax=Pseudoxanthomonas daejeonensis TaxID=266062 RepID=UPI0013909D9A|nr:hypothetical protein [Pseudoxanthomonas daejeonensis]
MSDNNDLKRILPPNGNLDFELVGHSARTGRMPVHSFKIRTTLESGERLDITQEVANALGRKTNQEGALNEGGMGYYKPDAIAGSLAETLHDQDRYKHTFKVRTSVAVSREEYDKHNEVVGLRQAVQDPHLYKQVEDFLRDGANANAQDRYGRAPLHLVSNERAAQALLAAGADVGMKDGWGQTPAEANPYSDAKRVIQVAANREALASVAGASSSRYSDLASPDEARARRSRGRSL